MHESIGWGLWSTKRMYAISGAAVLATNFLKTFLDYPQRQMPGSFNTDRIMELLALSKAEGTVPLETALPQEEVLWGYHSSLIVVTSSHRSGWTTALRAVVGQ